MKMTMPREFYVPTGDNVMVVQDEQSTAIAYLYESAGRPCLKAFSGRKAKPDLNFYFSSEAKRETRYQQFFESVRLSEAAVKARKEVRSAPHTLKIGDILYSSSGYSMTIVTFYEVTEITKHGATLEVIGDTTVSGSDGWSGTVIAAPEQRTGKFLKVRVPADNRPKVDSHSWASPWDGKPKHFNRMD